MREAPRDVTAPQMSLTASCFVCGQILFSDPWRPRISGWEDRLWTVMEQHEGRCPGARLEELRTVASLVRLGLQGDHVVEPLASHLRPLIDRLDAAEGRPMLDPPPPSENR